MLPHFPGFYVYAYMVWKAATSATMLMVKDLTRYKSQQILIVNDLG